MPFEDVLFLRFNIGRRIAKRRARRQLLRIIEENEFCLFKMEHLQIAMERAERQHQQRQAAIVGDPNALLPRYLFPIVRHYHDDFYVSRSFDPRLVVQLMSEGFLPIATRAGTRGYLLPKLHVERCVLRLSPESDLHVGRSTRKKGRRFLLSVNECFDAVVAGCHGQQ